jgi:hypothetical protein
MNPTLGTLLSYHTHLTLNDRTGHESAVLSIIPPNIPPNAAHGRFSRGTRPMPMEIAGRAGPPDPGWRSR